MLAFSHFATVAYLMHIIKTTTTNQTPTQITRKHGTWLATNAAQSHKIHNYHSLKDNNLLFNSSKGIFVTTNGMFSRSANFTARESTDPG